MKTELNVVTGAFGFTGKYITRLLLEQGKKVKTLTGHPGRWSPFGDRVEAVPFNFDDPAELARSLRGATTLYNTYWVRFPRGEITFERAVENSRVLVAAAAEAGMRRIVHISITNASGTSPFAYFRCKGVVEKAVAESGLSYAVIRPALIFGTGDIIVNNIAWLLRRYPIFPIFGKGDYRLRPVFVEDLAEIAVNAGGKDENMVTDAVGPEVYTFEALVRLIAEKIGSRAGIVRMNTELALFLSRTVGAMVGDMLLTRDEVEGLMAGLLDSDAPPAGRTRLSEWLGRNADTVGLEYASELRRHYQ
jgi:uncharacterized protein YbjT (DUF2867 family)